MTSPRTALALVLAVQLHCLAHGFSYRADQLRGGAGATPCRVRGRDHVMHGQQIKRADPCEFCICIDSNVFCWWGQRHCDTGVDTVSPAPLPRHDNATTTTADGSPTELMPEQEEEGDANSTCTVMGREYAAGAALPRETGTCLECVCGRGGRVTCSPKDCVHDSDPSDDSDDSNHASLDMFDVDVF